MVCACPPVAGDPVDIRGIDINQIAIGGIDALIFENARNFRQDVRTRIEIIRIENTDHFAGRQENPFVHGIVNPVIRFGNKLVDQVLIAKNGRQCCIG